MTLSHPLAALTALGCLYLLAALFMVGRLARRRLPSAAAPLSVTILKPLHGDEPGLELNLASFCRQAYAGPVQIICGVHRADDPAVQVVRRIIRAFPEVRIELVVDGRIHGANGKVSNLINMAEQIRHEVVVLSDSDIRVAPGWLAQVVDALDQPGIGGVTCLYRGRADAQGLWARLSALNIDTHFLPGAAFAVETGLASNCVASVSAAIAAWSRCRIASSSPRAASAAGIDQGSFAARAMARRAAGGPSAGPGRAGGHGCPERTFRDIWHHELRWARTIRSIDPLGHFGSLLTHPLPFAILWLLFQPGFAPLAAAALAVSCRIALCMRIEQAFGIERHAFWLIPMRDLLSFAVFVASFFGRGVRWKGQDYSVVGRGILAHDRRPTPP